VVDFYGGNTEPLFTGPSREALTGKRDNPAGLSGEDASRIIEMHSLPANH